MRLDIVTGETARTPAALWITRTGSRPRDLQDPIRTFTAPACRRVNAAPFVNRCSDEENSARRCHKLIC